MSEFKNRILMTGITSKDFMAKKSIRLEFLTELAGQLGVPLEAVTAIKIRIYFEENVAATAVGSLEPV